MRVIKNIESTSIGNTLEKNDDGIFVGENFIAVIDGVSSKSNIEINGEKIKIANIIVEAIKKIDSKNAPRYAKELTANEFIKIINMYIKKFCEANDISLEKNKLEATAGIYSRYYNQIWLIGDCRAVYDGKKVENELKIDDIYTDIRYRIIQCLLKEGYTVSDIFENDISHEIIKEPNSVFKYIKNGDEAESILDYINEKMHGVLLETGFTEEQIRKEELLKRFNTPQKLQEYAKNNPDAKVYGYSVFNGINTPIEKCKIVDLPDDVKNIRLSTDGFPIGILKEAKSIGSAIRKNRRLASLDPISIKENLEIHNSAYQDRQNHLAFDDETAVEIRIEEKNLEEKSRE